MTSKIPFFSPSQKPFKKSLSQTVAFGGFPCYTRRVAVETAQATRQGLKLSTCHLETIRRCSRNGTSNPPGIETRYGVQPRFGKSPGRNGTSNPPGIETVYASGTRIRTRLVETAQATRQGLKLQGPLQLHFFLRRVD